MPSVQIDEIGTVDFPEEMSSSDITRAIEGEIIPQHTQKRLASSPSMQPALPGQLPRPSPFSQAAAPEEPVTDFATARRQITQENPELGYLPGKSPEEVTARREAISRAANFAEQQRQADIGMIDRNRPDAEQAVSLANQLRDQRLRSLGFNLVDEGIHIDKPLVPFGEAIPTPPPTAGAVEKAATGIAKSAAGTGEFLTSPKGIAAMLNPAIGAGVLIEMAAGVPELGRRLDQAIVDRDWEGVAKYATDALLTVGVGAHLGKEGLKPERVRKAEMLAKELQRQIQSPEWQEALADVNRTAVNRMAPGTLRPEEIQGMPGVQHEVPPGAVISPNVAFPTGREFQVPAPELRRTLPIQPPVIEEPGVIQQVTRGSVKPNVLGGRESFSAGSPRLNREGLNREALEAQEKAQNAIQEQSAGTGVLRPQGSELELPGVGGGNGPEEPPSTVPVETPTKPPEAPTGENVLPPLTKDSPLTDIVTTVKADPTKINELTHDQFLEWARGSKGGQTGQSNEIGLTIDTPEKLARVVDAWIAARNTMLEGFKSGDPDAMQRWSTVPQFYSELTQTATGIGESANGAHAKSVGKEVPLDPTNPEVNAQLQKAKAAGLMGTGLAKSVPEPIATAKPEPVAANAAPVPEAPQRIEGPELQRNFKKAWETADEQTRLDILSEFGHDWDEKGIFIKDRDNKRYYLRGAQLQDAKREFLERFTKQHPEAAASPVPVSRRGTQAPPDLLHAVEDLLGSRGKMSLEQALRLDPNFADRPQWFKRLFRKGGRELDTLAQEIEGTHGFRVPSDEALYNGLLEVPAARRGDRDALLKQKEAIQREEQQKIDFDVTVGRGQRAKKEPKAGKPVKVEDLEEGEKFVVSGEEFTVSQVHRDPDTGEVMYVEVQDGRRFGTQTIAGDAEVHPDKRTQTTKGAFKAFDDIIAQLEQVKKTRESGQTFSLPHPDAIKAMGQAVWNTGIDIAIASIKAGKTVARAIADALEYFRKNAKAFDEAKIRDNLAEAIRTGERPEAEPSAPTPPAAVQKEPAPIAPIQRPTGPKDPLADVYQHFIPEPKARTPLKEIAKNASEAVRTGLSSKFRPLDRIVEDLNRVYGTGLKKVSGIFEALKGSSGRSEAQVYRFDRDVSKLVNGRELDFNAYMFLRRSLDRLRQDERDIASERARVAAEPIVREGGELNREKSAEARFTPNRRAVAGYTIPELEGKLDVLKQRLGPEGVAQFETAATRFQQYLDQALRWQVESGRMSPQLYDTIKSQNQFYAPFKVLKYLNEIARPEGTGARIDTPAEYTKAMVGIEDPNFKLGDMLAAARMNIRVSRILADKHAAMQTISRLAPFDVENRFIRKLEGDEKPGPDQTAVNVYQNGEHLRYAVPNKVAEALQIFQGKGNDLVSAVLSGVAVPFKAGATAWNIPFQVSNILADVPRAAFVSKFGVNGVRDLYRFPLDYIQSMYSSIMGDVVGRPNKLFLDFLESGSAGTTIQESMTPNALRFQQSPKFENSRNFAKSVLMTLPHFAAAIEQATKVLGVKRAMRETGSETGAELYRQAKEAVTEVRQFSGSPDFGRTGKEVEALRLNLLFMFLNARIQGTVSDVGRLTGRDGSAMAAKTWLKLGTAIGIPTAYLYAANHRSQQLSDDYDKIPEREKQNYWHIPKDTYITTDAGEKIRDYWRIPKRESAKWVANLVESSLDFAKNRSPEQAGRWFQSLVEDISPVNIQGRSAQERLESVGASLNPVIKAPIETATGRDMYRHRQLVPDQMKKASPENQYTDRTPEVYKRLANAIPDVAPEVFRSPIMLDNLVQNLTAGMISQFLPRKPIEGRTGIENTSLLQRFQAAPYTDQRVFRESMDTLQRQAADESLARTRLVDQLLRDNRTAPLPVIVQKGIAQGGKDPLLIERIVDSWVAKQNGITPQERQVMALPAKERAAYLNQQLKTATPEQKRSLIENWARKRILTEPVAIEMSK